LTVYYPRFQQQISVFCRTITFCRKRFCRKFFRQPIARPTRHGRGRTLGPAGGNPRGAAGALHQQEKFLRYLPDLLLHIEPLCDDDDHDDNDDDK